MRCRSATGHRVPERACTGQPALLLFFSYARWMYQLVIGTTYPLINTVACLVLSRDLRYIEMGSDTDPFFPYELKLNFMTPLSPSGMLVFAVSMTVQEQED